MDETSLPGPLRDLTAVAVAHLDEAGEVVAANRGFVALTGGQATGNVAHVFLQPSFDELARRAPSPEGLVHEGPLTLGLLTGATYGLVGRVTRSGRTLSLTAEHDVAALHQLHESVLSLNVDLSEARRQVARANRDLEAKIAARTAALAASEQRFRALVEHVPLGIGVLRGDSFAYANPALVALTGAASEREVIDELPFSSLLAPDERARVLRRMARIRGGDHAGAALHFEGARRDGHPIHVAGHCRAWEHEGQPALLVTLLDVTARKRAEDALRLAQAQAQTAERAKSVFLSTMSHELRTPLNHILGGAELLAELTNGTAHARYVGIITEGGRRLLQIVTDILHVTELASGGPTLLDADFAPARVLVDLVEAHAQRAGALGVRMSVDVAPEVPPVLRGDAARLTQALLSYVGNAVKYTHQGSITLRARLVDGDEHRVRLRFEVEDTGIGIAPEVKERLFTRFSQADEGHARRYGGVGLGLVITEQLARLLGGEAGCESALGSGSTFWLTARFRRAAGELLPDSDLTQTATQTLLSRVTGREPPALSLATVDPEAVRDLLERIEEKLAQDDIDAQPLLEQAAPVLAPALGAELDTLRDLVQRFDYADALDRIRRIRRR